MAPKAVFFKLFNSLANNFPLLPVQSPILNKWAVKDKKGRQKGNDSWLQYGNTQINHKSDYVGLDTRVNFISRGYIIQSPDQLSTDCLELAAPYTHYLSHNDPDPPAWFSFHVLRGLFKQWYNTMEHTNRSSAAQKTSHLNSPS